MLIIFVLQWIISFRSLRYVNLFVLQSIHFRVNQKCFCFLLGAVRSRRVHDWLFQRILHSVLRLVIFYIRVSVWGGPLFVNFLRWQHVINLEKYGHTSDIINHIIILTPFLCCSTHNCVSCLFRAVLQVVRPNNLTNLVVWKELPHSVRSNDNELVLRANLKLHHFWFSTDSSWMSDLISQRSTHRKPRHLSVSKPYSIRPKLLPLLASDSIHSASHIFNSFLFQGQRWFMINRHRSDHQYLILLQTPILWQFLGVRVQYSSWVTRISTEHCVSIK
jgi:hypothetical protein